jgi:predicted PurR-regulated permease PerM
MEKLSQIKVDITSGTIFRVVLILLGFAFLYYIADIVVMLLAAAVLAAAIEPVADYLEKYKVPRVGSVLLVYLVLIVITLGALTLMVEPLLGQIQQLIQATPRLVGQIHGWLPEGLQYDRQTVVSGLQSGLSKFGGNLANLSVNIFTQTRVVISGFTAMIFVFVLAFYLASEKNAMKKFARLVTPKEHLPFVEYSLDKAKQKVGKWVVAQLALGLIIGVTVGLGLWVLQVPYALTLGLLAGIMELIPVIGPIIAAIPGVIVGFSQSWLIGLLALALYVVVQQLENNVLVPNIMRKAIGLHPLVTIIAILFGARLAGLVGVILAVPIATIISIFLSDIFGEAKGNQE